MRIGVIHASSQRGNNALLYDTVCKCAGQNEVINLGCFEDETEEYSYVETAVLIGLLISGEAVDFVVTGCSSGQGMMLACNALPNIICGYCPTPQDAFLFGRINGGNVVSLPLGLNFGWCGEINLSHTLSALFDGQFGCGYPVADAERKQHDNALMKALHSAAKRNLVETLEWFDKSTVSKALTRKNVVDFILQNGKDPQVISYIKSRL